MGARPTACPWLHCDDALHSGDSHFLDHDCYTNQGEAQEECRGGLGSTYGAVGRKPRGNGTIAGVGWGRGDENMRCSGKVTTVPYQDVRCRSPSATGIGQCKYNCIRTMRVAIKAVDRLVEAPKPILIACTGIGPGARSETSPSV